MSRTKSFLIALSALALSGGVAMAQTEAPDQAAAPPGSNPNMGDGTGSGPSGSIGDPNGAGPGAAAPVPDASSVVDQPAPQGPRLSKGDAATLKSCLAMTTNSMNGVARCRTLKVKHPELFKGPASNP